MLIAGLALRDLWRDRFFFFCNLAVMVGVLVPLLVLFGVKNGIYQALVGQLLANPATLQIDTQGNAALTDSDIAPILAWPDVAFAVPRTRSQFDYVNLHAQTGTQSKIIHEALLLPSGKGDPNLPPDTVLGPDEVAISALVARQMGVFSGDHIDLITQAEGRPRQLVLPVQVKLILPEENIAGRSVLANYPTLDLIEAFYDSYAIPDHGILDGRPLSQRVPRYEGLRLYARDLQSLAALQTRVEAQLGLATSARAREVSAVLGLGRNLDVALALTSLLAVCGLAAALVFSFWSDVARKQSTLAILGILGLPARKLALFPLVQAAITAVFGLILSFGVYTLAAQVAADLFAEGLPPGARIAIIRPVEALFIMVAVLALVMSAASAAAWAAQRSDPARVLREGK